MIYRRVAKANEKGGRGGGGGGSKPGEDERAMEVQPRPVATLEEILMKLQLGEKRRVSARASARSA